MRIILFVLGFVFCSLAFSADAPRFQKILILVAMQPEAQAIVQKLGLKSEAKLDPNLPMMAYSGQVGHLQVELIWNGKDPVTGVDNIGTQPAVLATYLGILHFHPDLILNVGTAGVRPHPGFHIGDIYHSARLYFYDRRFHSADYKRYGVGGYYSYALPQPMMQDLHLHPVTVCSGDVFDVSPTDTALQARYGCQVIDMEAAAIAWVAQLTHTPMLALKGISNEVGKTTSHQEYEKHYPAVVKHLARTTLALLKELDGQREGKLPPNPPN